MTQSIPVSKVGWKPHQLRIWSYLNHRQDIFWPIETWPEWAQNSIVLAHKGDSQVFNLAVFLLVNGLDEATTFKWISARDVKNGIFQEGDYTRKERQDMERIRFRWSTGMLPLEGKRVFDMRGGYPMNAGDYQQGYARSRGNRWQPSVTLSMSEPAVRIYPEPERFDSDNWLE